MITAAVTSKDVKTISGDKFRQIENTITFFERKLSLSLKGKRRFWNRKTTTCKPWAMSGSPSGASNRRFASSYELFTLIETAKANGWNPLKYLTKVFQKAAAMKPPDDWGQLLPWNLAP
jgi:hypothetical protein